MSEAAAFRPSRLPRFIADLNDLARNAGLIVNMKVEAYENIPDEHRLWGVWHGTQDQFRSLGLIAAYKHFPLKRGFMNVPSGEPAWCNPLFCADTTVEGTSVTWEIDFGSPDYSIEVVDGAEVITYSNEVLYHGTAEALLAAGIPTDRLPVGSHRTGKRFLGYGAERKWRSRRLPNGQYLYRVEAGAAWQRRVNDAHRFALSPPRQSTSRTKPRPSFLRLVVNNGASRVGDRGSL